MGLAEEVGEILSLSREHALVLISLYGADPMSTPTILMDLVSYFYTDKEMHKKLAEIHRIRQEQKLVEEKRQEPKLTAGSGTEAKSPKHLGVAK